MGKYYLLSVSAKISVKHPKRIRFLSKNPEFKQIQSILIKIVRRARLIQFKKTDDLTNFINVVDKIIPNEFFGTSRHRKIFYRIIEKVLTRSKYECMYVNWFAVGYDHTKVPWLNEKQKENKDTSMYTIMIVNKWLMDNVVKPLIKKHFYFIITREGNKLDLVPKGLWMSYQAKTFRRALTLGYLTCSERLIFLEELHEAKSRGFVKFFPKKGYGKRHFRPIVNIFNTRYKVMFKNLSRRIYAAARNNCETKTANLYLNWRSYCENTKGQSIFGAKVDVTDAFGNININKLCYIIECIDVNLMSIEHKQKIIDYIKNQYVYFGWNAKANKPLIWQWRHGLLQGDWLSSSLCELYMNYLDSLYLKRFYKSNCLLYRGVDDYFFCSTSDTDVRRFLKTIQTIHEINRKKTQSNLPEYGDDVINYYGHTFHMKTKHVKSYYQFAKRAYIGNRFKIWNIHYQIPFKDTERFIQRPMQYRFNNHNFKLLYLNTIFNSERVVLENFYEAMVYVAFKFEAVVNVRFECIGKIKESIVLKQLQQIVYYYSFKSNLLLNKAKGEYNADLINAKLLRQIGYKAFLAVLKRRSLVYKTIIDTIEKKYPLKYLRGLKEMGMSIKYFQSLPTPFLNISIKRKVCITTK